jgi:hypothetical protein
MSAQPPVLSDPAAPILRGEPTISDDQRADLWDAFHTKSPEELAQHLMPLAIPDDFKRKLYQAKQQATPPVPILDKTTEAINRVAKIDPAVLELAEAHPNVLRALTAAATAAEKPPAEASGANKPASKGKEAGKTAPLSQPPRIDGLDHMQPIPDGHHRVLGSDGGVWDIPAENLDKAREIDPRLHVLNP